ncbi:MAG: hypothetical protein ACOY3I_05795 [Verrucomicrobiota bacterium]
MKLNLKILIIALGVEFIVCLLGLGGATFIVISKAKTFAVEAKEKETVAVHRESSKEHSGDLSSSQESGFPAQTLKPVVNELDQWRAELNTQKEKLLAMDQDIMRRETILKAERESVEKEKAKILEMQKQLSERVLSVQVNDAQKYKELAVMFTKMKVDQVVLFMKMFPDDQTSKLMSFIPNKQLIKILEYWSITYPDDRERLMRVTSQIRRVIQEPLISSANETAQKPEIQTQ